MNQESHGSVKSYTIGFILSIILTVIPLVLVLNKMMSPTALVVTIIAMAVLQFLVQLFFFMHIKEGEKPRYNVMALILGVVIVVTIVAGSVWIMSFNSQVQ
ncbi:cytochrome o ubiquinol oxidase subunit IV [Lihuaxuella thermophila]|uniref:Cytochrome o ubiquinol oxidase operon protein cyoD n=1 Tax=Lihuaxuella thermophila TaxID=1173111 RepID=A0A1H8HXP7_9BACL|nr:cytochrome o ubiquinol oxidase subunit IV [Lihuaxuella thermophila]SEN60656.1 cytochrome o ubiquinol oxidase operon protein cyoD [Lihuaxuella thermophila]